MNKFYSLLTTNDSEDLLCMWLYHKYGYICVPSTNKIATEKYECVLLNPDNGNPIYIQVKKGRDNLNAEDYVNLNGEVWLLTTEGEVFNHKHYDNINKVNPEDLYQFAISEEADNILPKSIKNWVGLLKEKSK